MNTRKLVGAAIFMLCLSPLSGAFGADVDAKAFPEAKTQNGINYLSGGIGADQVKVMESAAKDYSLMLTFAVQQSGDYLADVRVKIADMHGKPVLDAVADGPMMLIQLHPGQYKISAVNNNHEVTKTVLVSGNHTTKAALYWPESAVK